MVLLPVLSLFQTVEKQSGCIVERGQMAIAHQQQNLSAILMAEGLFSAIQHPSLNRREPE